jgi:hypothetical protein
MSQESPKNNTTLIVIAIIGVLGTIIGAIITVIGNYNVEKLHQETELTRVALAFDLTRSVIPQNTPNTHIGDVTPVVTSSATSFSPTIDLPAPTYTPYPTLIPVVITATSEPMVSSSANTSPDSILEVGQSWQQDDLLLTLSAVNYNPDFPESECDISFGFYIESVAVSNLINISVSPSQFQAVDNLNRSLPKAGFTQEMYCPPAHRVDPFSGIVEHGNRFPSSGYNTWQAGFTVNLTDTNLDYIIVTVNGLYRFNNAKWKVPIYN